MAYKIDNTKCLNCGSCLATCCSDAVEQNNNIYNINVDNCISCGACSIVCPAKAISEI